MTYLFKLLVVCSILIKFSLRALFINLTTHDPHTKRKRLMLNTSKTGKELVHIFGFKLHIINPEKIKNFSKRNHLIVANHVSYTDIPVLSSIYPMVFITSTDMGKTPFLGQITQLGGSLYTDRTRIATIRNEVNILSQALEDGFDLSLFPEATSYNGEIVHPFKKSLFEAAIRSKTPILPLCIKYVSIDGKPFSLSNRDLICWYGDMAFFPHFPKLLTLKEVIVEITLLDEIQIEDGMDRQTVSDLTFQKISEVFEKYPALS
jgi:lyso-ornithine lipid O-acyltransferase